MKTLQDSVSVDLTQMDIKTINHRMSGRCQLEKDRWKRDKLSRACYYKQLWRCLFRIHILGETTVVQCVELCICWLCSYSILGAIKYISILNHRKLTGTNIQLLESICWNKRREKTSTRLACKCLPHWFLQEKIYIIIVAFLGFIVCHQTISLAKMAEVLKPWKILLTGGLDDWSFYLY